MKEEFLKKRIKILVILVIVILSIHLLYPHYLGE